MLQIQSIRAEHDLKFPLECEDSFDEDYYTASESGTNSDDDMHQLDDDESTEEDENQREITPKQTTVPSLGKRSLKEFKKRVLSVQFTPEPMVSYLQVLHGEQTLDNNLANNWVAGGGMREELPKTPRVK